MSERINRGKQKREIKYIENKASRQDAFYKRKTGIMKKAHELASLTGNQVLLLITSETGHVYSYATSKFQSMFSNDQSNSVFRECLEDIGVKQSQLTGLSWSLDSQSNGLKMTPGGQFQPPQTKPWQVPGTKSKVAKKRPGLSIQASSIGNSNFGESLSGQTSGISSGLSVLPSAGIPLSGFPSSSGNQHTPGFQTPVENRSNVPIPDPRSQTQQPQQPPFDIQNFLEFNQWDNQMLFNTGQNEENQGSGSSWQ